LSEGTEQEVTLMLRKLSEEHVVVEPTFVEEVDPPTPPRVPLINMAGGDSFFSLVCRN
jgi:hypothetical protein